MPGRKHLKGATKKQNRMYEHVLKSTGSKRIAAATVNKYRGKLKRKRKR